MTFGVIFDPKHFLVSCLCGITDNEKIVSLYYFLNPWKNDFFCWKEICYKPWIAITRNSEKNENGNVLNLILFPPTMGNFFFHFKFVFMAIAISLELFVFILIVLFLFGDFFHS